MIEDAENILNAICLELDSAESASDPYPVEPDYLREMLEDTEGLITRCYEGWVYSMPTADQAARIVAAHPDFFE